jgi:hypothetical protein
MRTLFLSLAVMMSQWTAAAADPLPKIASEKLCKARSADEKMMKFVELQSVPDCIREENEAKQKLGAVWDTTDSTTRNRCKAQAIALGTLSYVDLLTCIQTAEDIKSQPPGKTNPSRSSGGK